MRAQEKLGSLKTVAIPPTASTRNHVFTRSLTASARSDWGCLLTLNIVQFEDFDHQSLPFSKLSPLSCFNLGEFLCAKLTFLVVPEP